MCRPPPPPSRPRSLCLLFLLTSFLLAHPASQYAGFASLAGLVEGLRTRESAAEMKPYILDVVHAVLTPPIKEKFVDMPIALLSPTRSVVEWARAMQQRFA